MQQARFITISSDSVNERPADTSKAGHKPKLMDRLREALRSRHYSRRTEQTYCYWVKRFIFFHEVRHPVEMAEPEINAFLTHLAVKEKVSASTQNQALSALLFLYRHVIGREVGDLGKVIRDRKPTRLPVAMTGEEGRHHTQETILQRAVKEAVRNACVVKHAGYHTSVTPLLCTCLRPVMIFAPSRNFLAIKTSAQR